MYLNVCRVAGWCTKKSSKNMSKTSWTGFFEVPLTEKQPSAMIGANARPPLEISKNHISVVFRGPLACFQDAVVQSWHNPCKVFGMFNRMYTCKGGSHVH